MSTAKSIIEKLDSMKEEVNVKDIIQELIDTDWSKDNKSQMKALQLLKGIALSDEPEANAFMQKLDSFTSGISKSANSK